MKLTKLFILFIIAVFSFTSAVAQNVIERSNPPVLVTDLAGVLMQHKSQMQATLHRSCLTNLLTM
jgi:hypothetical protein